MFNIRNTIKNLMTRKASKWILSAAAMASLAGSAAPASAHEHVNVSIRVGEPCPVGYVDRETRYWVAPVYQTVTDRVFVEAVYQDRVDRVWVEPVYQDRVERFWVEPIYQVRHERVLVPEVWEVREVRKIDTYTGRTVIVKDRILVKASYYETRDVRVCVAQGHWDERHTRVCVSEGRWQENHTRVCVTEGHWQVVDRQVLVSEGHWDTRIERVRVETCRSVAFVPTFGFAFGR